MKAIWNHKEKTMKTKIYWGLSIILSVILIGVSAFLLTRPTDTEPKNIYRDVDPSEQMMDQIRHQTQQKKTSTQAPVEDTDLNADNITPNSKIANIETKTNDNTKKPVRISRYGFGVLPDIPDEAPIAPFDDNMDAEQELLALTLLKLWNDGDKNIGGGFYDPEQGKVYPYYPNVIYVEYEMGFNPVTFKEEIMIAGATSSYDNADVVQDIVSGGAVPPGYKLIDVENAGIAPYVFLDLPEK